MSDEFIEDLDEEFDTITMIDDETNEEIEFVIIDNVEHEKNRYLLVVESELIDDDEAEAIILKEISDDDKEVTYEVLEADEEFDNIAALFQDEGSDYDVQL